MSLFRPITCICITVQTSQSFVSVSLFKPVTHICVTVQTSHSYMCHHPDQSIVPIYLFTPITCTYITVVTNHFYPCHCSDQSFVPVSLFRPVTGAKTVPAPCCPDGHHAESHPVGDIAHGSHLGARLPRLPHAAEGCLPTQGHPPRLPVDEKGQHAG